MVGNYITDGSANWKRITAYTSGLIVTVDSAPSWTTQTIYVGGALASLGGCAKAVPVTGNIIYIQSGSTYSITSASTNVSGGCYNSGARIAIVGYATNRTMTNTDAAAHLQLNVASATLFTSLGGVAYNLILDGNSQTSSKCNAGGSFDFCTIENFNTVSTGSSIFTRSLATGNSASIFTYAAIGCEAYGNSATPFAGDYFVNCLSYGNTGGSTYGFSSANTATCFMSNCTAYNNGSSGFFNLTSSQLTFINCYSENNAAYGFNLNSTNCVVLIDCGAYNNTSGAVNTTSTNNTFQNNFLTLTSTAFVAAGSNNFALNSTAGGGATLRNAGYPGTFPRGTTVGYNDVGAVRHQDPSGSNVYAIGQELGL